MSWYDDPKFKRPIGAERTESVTDQAAAVNVTPVYTPSWTRCICEQCGKEFNSKRRQYGTKFCSNACRQKHYRQTKKECYT